MASRLPPVLALLALSFSLALGCEDPAKNAPRAPSAQTAQETAGASPTTQPTTGALAPRGAPPGPKLVASKDDESIHLPAPERLVAIGDLHGDLVRTLRALKLAGAIDEKSSWIGGKLVVVQVGDQLDRGDDDRAILDLLERLQREARAAGGDLVAMLGNHEIMNAQLDFRYVTEGSLPPFGEFASVAPPALASRVPKEMHGRAVAFLPGGPYAKKLAEHPVVAWHGQNLFAHGGILPKHVREGLAKIDKETREWLRGDRNAPPKILTQDDGPIWTRLYSAAPGPVECGILDQVLDAYSAKRMIVGHTVQRGGIRAACDGKIWRIDCGMSRYYGGPVEVLQIRGDETVVLKDTE